MSSLRMKFTLFMLCMLVAVTGAFAAQYKSLGIARSEVIGMLVQEGLNPTFNKFPDYQGEPVTSATVHNPYLDLEMIGPDNGLTEITLTTKPTTDENETYWQGYVSLWLLGEVFPNWPNREEWLFRAIVARERIEFSRDGYTIAMALSADGKFLFLVISGDEIG